MQTVSGSPALKLIPPPGRVVVLAAQRVGVNVRRRPNRGVSQALGNHWRRHAVCDQV